MGRWKFFGIVFGITTVLVMASVSHDVRAVSSQSTNYNASEIQFGAGSSLETCSGQYCASASIGGVVSGEANSPSQKLSFGDIATNSDPLLEMIIEPGTSDLGVLSQTQTSSKTVIVKVRTYLSDGYTMQINGSAPTYNGHALTPLSSPTASLAGTEQFGINLADNTTPDVGAAPAQVPSDDFSFGEATDDYNTANLFKYSSGDVVASSLSESGQTDYTISMIINISSKTPAGHYTSDFSAVVVPVF